jgi:hypothetical protein
MLGAGMTDHDELVSGLHQMKPPLSHFGAEPVAANLTVYPRDIAADDMAIRRLGRKDQPDPGV